MDYRSLYTNDREALMLLSHLTEPGDKQIAHFVHSVGLYPALHNLLTPDSEYPNLGGQLAVMRKRVLPRQPRIIMAELHARWEAMGIRVVIPPDAEWPRGLTDLGEQMPWCLYVKGQPLRLDYGDAPVSIVGARAATSYGETVARDITEGLAGNDRTIVSGGMYGIDAAAHRAALDFGKPTIAFMAGGVDRAYPVGHTDLLNDVLSVGSMASEMPPGSSPTRHRFLSRNRLIAAVSEGTVVVEAGFRSGSLDTANHVRDLGHRALMAVPGPVTSATSAGTNFLIQQGATLVTDHRDVERALIHNAERRLLSLSHDGTD